MNIDNRFMKLDFDFSRMHDRLLFLIQIDGLAYNPFAGMIESGELPNIASLLKDRPSTYGPSVSTYPSSTAPSLPELFTGRWADSFFKRPRKINAFDRLQKKALKYEFLPDAWDGEFLDIFNIFRNNGDRILSLFSGEFNSSPGVVTYHDNLYFGLDALGKFSGREIVIYDRRVVDKLIEFIEAGSKPPRIVFLGLSSADLAGHFQGPGSDIYKSGLVEIDSCVGKLINFLKNTKHGNGNLYDKSVFIVFGDHGMMDSDKFVDVVGVLKADGLRISDLGSIGHLVAEKLNPFWMMDREILSVPGGSNITELYVRKKSGEKLFDWNNFTDYSELRHYPVQGWFNEGKIDLIDTLLEIEGVGEIIASPYKDVAVVHTPDRGNAVIYRRFTDSGQLMAYQPVPDDGNSATKDPFGYLDHPVAADMVCSDPSMDLDNFTESRFDMQFLPQREWIKATRDSQYPGAAALIPKALAIHHTASDMMVNARKQYNFSKYFRGDHGSLDKEVVLTGLLFSGPGIRDGADLSGFLWVDLLPTVLELMRIGVPSTFAKSMDGTSCTELLDDGPA